jgi:AcrR family transcriptional regulator
MPQALKPSAGRRERGAERTRDVIIEAARELFVRDGYESVSVRRIASKAGVSHGTIYLHFRDKDDLLLQISEEQFARLFGRLRRLPRSKDPLVRLEATFREIVLFGFSQPHEYLLMSGIQATIARHKSQWGPIATQVEDFVRDIVAEVHGRANGSTEEMNLTILLAFAHGLVVINLVQGLTPETAGALLDQATDLVFTNLRHSYR